MTTRRMDEVELVEVDGPDAPDDADPRAAARRARTRRLLRRWWPVPVVAVLGVVGWQVLTDARERAVVERLREVDGVIGTTVTPPLTATPWGTDGIGLGLTGLTVPAGPSGDGALFVGLASPDLGDGWDVIAVDTVTGAEVWRVPVGLPSDGAGQGTGYGCSPEQVPTRAVWCELTTTDARGAATTLVVRVDVDARAVTAREVTDGERATTAGGGLFVEATRSGDVVTVAAVDGATAEPAWSTDLTAPLPEGGDPLPPDVVVDGDLLWVWSADGSQTALDLASGRLLAEGEGLTVARGHLLEVEGSNATTLLGPDGSGTTEVPGLPVPVGLDDGSLPGLVLLHRIDGSADGRLTAVDAVTGERRWEQPGLLARSDAVIVLDGVVYGGSSREVWAVDAEDGTVRWRTAGGVAQTTSWRAFDTDGVAVLRTERDTDSGDDVLAAYRLRDGVRLWAEPLPEGTTSAQAVGGVLFGFGDGVVALG